MNPCFRNVVKQTRTAIDFAEVLHYMSDELYPKSLSTDMEKSNA